MAQTKVKRDLIGVLYTTQLIGANANAEENRFYVFTAACTLTLPATPTVGDSIKISNRSGLATPIIARNGKKIMGASEDLTIDKLNAGFEMIFSGDTHGWLLVSVEGTT